MTAPLHVSRHAILCVLTRRADVGSVRDLSALSGVPIPTLYRAAATRVISTANAAKLARALKVDASEIAALFEVRDAGTGAAR